MNENEAPPMTTNGLSDEQEIVLFILRICSASLSVIGSSTIVFKILRDRAVNQSWTPYDRIILGLSSCDILSSITWAIYRFLDPSETGGVWAFGNAATCQIAGFLFQLGFLAWWYNAILSLYFLLTVLSQVRGKNFVRKSEAWMHLSGIYFPITAIVGLRRKWYNTDADLGDLCYIADPMIKWIAVGIPTLVVLFFLVINNIVIFSVVRKSLRSSEHVAGPTLVQKRIKREATTLMILYVASFFITVSPAFVTEIVQTYFIDSESKIYPLIVLGSILVPLQGFFNVFIYMKPAYTRFRAANPNKPMRFVLHQSLFNPNVPQLTVLSDQSASNANLEEDAKEEESNLKFKGKTPRKMRRKKSEDDEEDGSVSDSSA